MGDLFMSLIHTFELNGVNSFQYLIELQQHASVVAASSSEWTPWTYRRRWIGPVAHDDTRVTIGL